MSVSGLSACYSPVRALLAARRRKPPSPKIRLLICRSGGTDAITPPNLVAGAACLGLLQNRYHLRLGRLRLAHGNHHPG
jgi:hypothetical protein